MMNKVEIIINSIRNIKRASTSPYFYNKIISRLRYQENNKIALIFYKNPYLSITSIIFMVLLNLFSIYTISLENSANSIIIEDEEQEFSIEENYFDTNESDAMNPYAYEE